MDDETKKRIARGTLDTFAPVAEAVGLWTVKAEMEDASLKILEPALFAAIADDLRERLSERLARTNRAIAAIRAALASEGLAADITGRPKHIHGLSRKVRQGMQIAEVNDATGVRIITRSEADCYAALGALSRHFGLVSGVYEAGKLYRDWIERPKPNGYQSIHTTIEFEDRLVEVQLRTHAMHEVAEYGLAAHWVYREAGNSPRQQRKFQPYVGDVAAIRRQLEARARQRDKLWRAKSPHS